MEVQAQEKKVGRFRADILCKEVGSGSWVVIENQLERSDHDHLGQLLTYASGLDTATIIWVAPSFCHEHRIALDWLNRITNEQFRFFAVQIEVWSISGSLPAPKFNLVTGPNGWSRRAKKLPHDIEAKRSDSAKRRLEYWQVFLSKLRLSDPEVRLPNPNSLGNLRFNLQGRDLWITVYAASSSGRIGVFLRGSSEHYPRLLKTRRAIEAQLGEPSSWSGDENDWTVAISRRSDPTNRAEWSAQHKWLATRLGTYIRVFKPYGRM